MKGLTKASMILSALTAAIGGAGLILSLLSMQKARKIEKALED